MNEGKIIALALLMLVIFIGSASAHNIDDINLNQTADNLSAVAEINQNYLESSFEDTVSENSPEEIVVESWDDLQYYCSLDDNDYTLKLKENTNYYPTNVSDESYQINIKNNVHIIGAEGAYIGDSSPDAAIIEYAAIKVDDNTGIGVTVENVTFKWISSSYQSDGVFFVMGGNADNIIKNCYFTNITTNIGHSSILHLKRGSATLSNCTFVNCTTDFGCVSIYDPEDDPTKLCTGASMNVDGCYFEGNYAKTEPGCINNCGILVVSNSTFYKNTAFWWAGAIHTHGGANTTIYDSEFTDNLAGWNGGALYTYSYLQIYNSNFTGNNCTTNNGGGAIGACKYLHAPYLYIDGCMFKYNENTCWATNNLSSGTGRGGAISLMDEGGLEVYNTVFIKNSASIGTAICAINGGLQHGSPDVKIIGNHFINHTRVGDVLDVRLAAQSSCEIRDNYFSGNSIVFSKLKLTADDPVGGKVKFHIDAVLKNPKSYDADILEKTTYDVYADGVYKTTVSSSDFTLNLGNGKTSRIYVVPSISTSKSNEVLAGIVKTYTYVSQSRGSDGNDGSSRAKPVKTLNKSIELARSTSNIVIMDGTFKETNLVIDYNLTITAENNAAVTVIGNAFTVTGGDVSFVNLIFKNSKYGSSTKNRLISHTGNGFLIFEGCQFDSNEYKVHIESSGSFEGENLKFTNNKDGSVIKSDSVVLKSSVFNDNVATYANSKGLVMYKTATVKLEADNVTFTGNTVLNGCIDVSKGSSIIENCNFISNILSTTSGKASSVMVESGSSTEIRSCKFINNTDIGNYASAVYTSGTLRISDSILIGNTNHNKDNLTVNGVTSGLQKLSANNNWWGNTPQNLSKPALKEFEVSVTLKNGWNPATYWLVLNGTVLSNDIEVFDKVAVQFVFSAIDGEGNVTSFDGGFMPSVDLTLKAVNGTCSDKKITMDNGMATTYFTLTEMSGGSLTASYNGIDSTVYFSFKKTLPPMTLTSDNITVGSSAEIDVNLGTGVNGNVIVKVGNVTQTKMVYTSQSFTVPDLPAGEYIVEVNYTGNERYESVVKTFRLNVSKFTSDISISAGKIEIGKDAVFTFNLTEGATGTVDVYVNGEFKSTVGITDCYTINEIGRGDYIVKAVYMGDARYLSSEDVLVFDVAKLTSKLSVHVNDITYGDKAAITVSLNEDATGLITAAVDGKSNSSQIIDGKAVVYIADISAGANKKVTVTYSGDNNYKNASASELFNVAKGELDFAIKASDIKLGNDAVVEITLPARMGGTLSVSGIRNEVKNVPASGIVKLTYSDLPVGNYTVSVQYGGNNYNTASKSISFEVSAWDEPQWANTGGNVRHDSKSLYDSGVNGNLAWSAAAGEITGNMLIDAQSNIYVTLKEGVCSFDSDGNLRWNFTSDSAGDYFSGISLSRDVIIAPKVNDTIYFINITSGERYGHANIYQGSSLFAPVVDDNANIYISGQAGMGNPNLVVISYKLWKNGGTPSVLSLGSGSYPTGIPSVLNDNLVIVPVNTGLKVVNVSSKLVVSSIPLASVCRYAVIGDGNIIYALCDDSIVSVDPNGNISWTSQVTGTAGDALYIDSEQAVYSVNGEGILYKYDLMNGTESKMTDLKVTSGILIGNDNNLYFASDNVFYAMDSEGNILWKSQLDLKITGTPIMDNKGTLYVSSSNKIYALKESDLTDAGLSVSVKNLSVGENETVEVTLNENATGIVKIEVNGISYLQNITDGKVMRVIENLPAGNYPVNVNYLGDMRYSKASKSVAFEVVKKDSKMNVTSKNIKYGQNAVFDISLEVKATGTVSVTVAGKSYSSSVKNGKSTVAVSGLSKNDYEYTLNYSGDDYYAPSVKKGTVSVSKNEFTFDVKPIADVTVDNPVEFIITGVPDDATGKFTVTAGDLSNRSSASDGRTVVVLNDLAVNTYTAVVVYNDDNNYNAESRQIAFNVVKKVLTDSSVEVSVKDITVGQNAKFIIYLASDVSGNVTVSVDGQSVSGSIYDGRAVIYISNLTAGFKKATVSYDDGDKYKSLSLSKEFRVNKIVPQITVNADDINVGETAVFDISVNSDAEGTVTVSVGGRTNSSKLIKGHVKIPVSGLTYGIKEAVVTYVGDEKYLSSDVSCNISVNRLDSQIRVEAGDVGAGENAVITVKSSIDRADVVISLNNDNYTLALDGGSATLSLSDLGAGSYDVTVHFKGNGNYAESYNSTSFKVIKQEIHVTDDTIPESDDAGKYSINLPDDATGNFTVTVDGVDYTQTLVNGKATVSIPDMTDGTHSIIIKYSGDKKYSPIVKSKIITVNNRILTHFDTADNVQFKVYAVDYTAGERGKNLVFRLLDVNNNPVAGVSVKLSYNNKEFNRTTDDNGAVSFGISTQFAGLYPSSVFYGGSDKYGSANVNFTIKVNKKPLTITAKAKTFKAKLKTKKYTVTLKTKKCSSKNAKIYLKSGKKLTLKIKGKTYTAKINKKGKATFKITKLTKKGKYTAVIKYKGDKTYKAVSKKVKITIK